MKIENGEWILIEEIEEIGKIRKIVESSPVCSRKIENCPSERGRGIEESSPERSRRIEEIENCFSEQRQGIGESSSE